MCGLFFSRPFQRLFPIKHEAPQLSSFVGGKQTREVDRQWRGAPNVPFQWSGGRNSQRCKHFTPQVFKTTQSYRSVRCLFCLFKSGCLHSSFRHCWRWLGSWNERASNRSNLPFLGLKRTPQVSLMIQLSQFDVHKMYIKCRWLVFNLLIKSNEYYDRSFH